MKVCQIWGDLSSEKSSENYPTEVFCDECYKDMLEKEKKMEDNIILSTMEYDPNYGDECYSCNKTVEEEEEEKR